MRKTTAHTPAPGNPKTKNPTLAKKVWIMATPRIPVVTLRMGELMSSWNSGPFSPKRRLARARAASEAARAFANNAPATTMDKTKCRTGRASPADAESNAGMADVIWGANRWNTAVKLVDAVYHSLLSRGPMMGHVATLSGGGGMVRVPSLVCATKV